MNNNGDVSVSREFVVEPGFCFVRVGDDPDTERDSLPRDDSVGTKAVAGGGRFERPTPCAQDAVCKVEFAALTVPYSIG